MEIEVVEASDRYVVESQMLTQAYTSSRLQLLEGSVLQHRTLKMKPKRRHASLTIYRQYLIWVVEHLSAGLRRDSLAQS